MGISVGVLATNPVLAVALGCEAYGWLRFQGGGQASLARRLEPPSHRDDSCTAKAAASFATNSLAMSNATTDRVARRPPSGSSWSR